MLSAAICSAKAHAPTMLADTGRWLVVLLAGGPLYDEGAEQQLGDCRESNQALIASLRPDSNEDALHKIALGDYEKGRMTEPRRVTEADIDQVEQMH